MTKKACPVLVGIGIGCFLFMIFVSLAGAVVDYAAPSIALMADFIALLLDTVAELLGIAAFFAALGVYLGEKAWIFMATFPRVSSALETFGK